MLFLHETLSVTPSRQDEVIARVRGIHSYMLKHPGFVGARIARYLGAPNEYLVLRSWRRPEDLEDYRKGGEIPNWGANRPEGIYIRPPHTTRWESIASNGQATSTFVVRTIYRPAAGRTDALMDLVKGHDDKAVMAGLMLKAELFRSLEDDEEMTGAVLSLMTFADRDAYDAYLRSASAEELADASGRYEVTLSGCYEIVVDEFFRADSKTAV